MPLLHFSKRRFLIQGPIHCHDSWWIPTTTPFSRSLPVHKCLHGGKTRSGRAANFTSPLSDKAQTSVHSYGESLMVVMWRELTYRRPCSHSSGGPFRFSTSVLLQHFVPFVLANLCQQRGYTCLRRKANSEQDLLRPTKGDATRSKMVRGSLGIDAVRKPDAFLRTRQRHQHDCKVWQCGLRMAAQSANRAGGQLQSQRMSAYL